MRQETGRHLDSLKLTFDSLTKASSPVSPSPPTTPVGLLARKAAGIAPLSFLQFTLSESPSSQEGSVPPEVVERGVLAVDSIQ